MMTRTDRRRFPILLAATAALALAMALLFSTVQAQEGSAPDQPRGLSATATHDQVVLTWDDPQDDTITGYVILRRVRVNNTGGEFSGLVPDTGSAATTYTDDTVAAGITYTYRIKAINAAGTSERSRWFHIDIPAAPVPDKPAGLSATATHDQVVLTWDDPQDDTITGYVILRRVRVNNTGGEFSVLVADTGSAATTYTDDTVAAGITYTYRIKAINAAGTSERSRWFHIDIPAAPVPDKPAGLSATATHDQVVLTWDDPQDDTITGYVILRRVRVNNTGGEFSVLVADTGTAATTYTDDSVQANTTYTYRIKAINGHGVSERSRWSHINVPAAPEAGEGDDPDGEDDGGAPGGPGKRANVSEPDGGDLPVDNTTTGEVDVGGSVTGNIGFGLDGDWFKVVLEAGTRYQIDLEGADTSRGTLPDPRMGLYASNALVGSLSNDEGVGKNARRIYTPTAAGDYYVRAQNSNGSDTGTYTLSMIVLGANGASEADTDFPATTATTGRVDVGASATGNIGTDGDADWFRVDLEAGKTYQFDLEGPFNGRGTLEDPLLKLFESGVRIALNDDSGATFDSKIIHTPTAGGTYYLEAIEAGEGVSSVTTGTYTLSVREIPPCTLNTGDIWCGVVTVAEIKTSPGDALVGHGFADGAGLSAGSLAGYPDDTMFSVGDNDYTIGAAYIQVPTGSTVTGALFVLLSADLTDDDKAGLVLTVDDTTITFAFSGATKGTTGLYSWGLSGLTWSAGDTVTVRLSAPPPDDFPADTTTTGQVDVGGSATGNVESVGDADWFLVELEAGTRYQIDLEGTPTVRGTMSDPIINAVRDAGGDTIAGTRNDDSGVGNNARTIFTATASGAHYVVAAAYQSTGTYTLSVIVLGANGASEADTDFPDTTATTGRVDVGASVTGNIENNADYDMFRVDLEAGKIYQIDLEGAHNGRGTLPDPYLLVYDGLGTAQAQYNDVDNSLGNLNSRGAFAPTATGTYYLEVLEANSANTGTYTLSVRDITPPPDDSPDDSGNVPDPVTDLLSNLGQATNTNFGLLIGTFENAQGFTTGSDSHGYFLAGISLDVNAVPRTPADVTISLWSATSDSPPKPDAAVATLTHSTDTWATGVNTFNAPGGTVLDPGTTYFVVQSYSGARAHLGLRATASGSADDDSTGWSVAGARLTRSHTDLGDWSRRSGEYTKFSVSGAAVPAQGVAEGATDLPTNVSEPDGEDLPADTTTTGEVEVGGSVTGNVDRDADVDWFAVELKKGKRYQFDVEGADTGRGNLADPFLWGLYDAGGQAISDARSNDGGVGKNGRVIYTPTADGTYYIAAAGTATMTGTYTLSVILLGANGASEADTDFPRDTSTTGRVEVGASATGNIDPGEDLDGFRVNLEAGKRYRFDLEGADTGRGSQADPILALYGDSFNVSHYIDEDDDGGEGLNSRLTYTATATGIYHLEVAGLDPGTYTLSVREILLAVAVPPGGLGPSEIPGAVRNVSVSYSPVSGIGGQIVWWDAPDETGTGAQWITEFRIYGSASEGCGGYLLDAYEVEHPGSTTPPEINGVPTGFKYFKIVYVGPVKFGVAAVNELGEGPCVEGPDPPPDNS